MTVDEQLGVARLRIRELEDGLVDAIKVVEASEARANYLATRMLVMSSFLTAEQHDLVTKHCEWLDRSRRQEIASIGEVPAAGRPPVTTPRPAAGAGASAPFLADDAAAPPQGGSASG